MYFPFPSQSADALIDVEMKWHHCRVRVTEYRIILIWTFFEMVKIEYFALSEVLRQVVYSNERE
jgi:hypothetical protein